MTWQPIETAPKDGRLIVVGAWYEHEKFWLYQALARKSPYEDFFIDESRKLGDQRKAKIETATHWHELPDTPEN